jgi:hypothetical protein
MDMKRIKFSLFAVLAVVAFNGIGCDDDRSPVLNDTGKTQNINPPDDDNGGTPNPGSEEPPLPTDSSDNAKTLGGTSWKTVGIMDAQTDSLMKLEPKDCWNCYTLTFDTDTTFSSFSTTNHRSGTYSYEAHNFHIASSVGTELGELGDGYLWGGILWSIDIFTRLENELRLYYNKRQNYLLFIPHSK